MSTAGGDVTVKSPSPGPVTLLTDFSEAAVIPTRFGEFRAVAFAHEGREHVALTRGHVTGTADVLVRVHSSCLTGDVFGSHRCDCGAQLDEALRRIAAEGRGVLLYLNQEGRGIGLVNKIRAYHLQESGADTVEANEALGFPADVRDFSGAAAMLRHLGVTRVRLLTNNPRKVVALEAGGIAVAERVPLVVGRRAENSAYLDAKQTKLGHLLG